MMRVGRRTNRLFHIWTRDHVPPWEVLGVRWSTRARRAWYLAAITVRLEDEQTIAQKRAAADALRQHDAPTVRRTPRVIGVPIARRLL